MHIHLHFPGENFTHYWAQTNGPEMLEPYVNKLTTWHVIHKRDKWVPKSAGFKSDGRGSIVFVIEMEELR